MKCARYVSDAEKYKLCYSVWKISMVKYFTVWILKKKGYFIVMSKLSLNL